MCAASPTPCPAGDLDFSISVPCHLHTLFMSIYAGRIRRAKECDNNAKYCESPRQRKWCYSGADSITSSVHQDNVTAQHKGSSARHLGIGGTAITSFTVEKLIILRRWWYAPKSFLHTSNRWTSCSVSVCSHCKIVAKSPGTVPTALLPPCPADLTSTVKGAFTCSFSQRVLIKGL